MYIIPPTTVPDRMFSLEDDTDGNTPARKWSSLIGVVTAICGNILISFALNTQRYAHMRLTRDRELREQEKRRRARRNGTLNASNGIRQKDIARERARQNAKIEPEDYSLEDPDDDADETQPLIPKVKITRNGSASALSDDAARADDGDDDDDAKRKSYLRSPIWWLGIALMVVGEAGNFLAYGFAPASIVSPLGVVALISNCLIAPLLLGERFRWRDALGVLIATGGCVVVVLSASESNPRLTPDAIWDLITRWEFETYLGITIFLIIVLAVASTKFGEKSILIDLGLVGLFGGYTALSTKGVASLLSNTIWRVVTFPISYLLVAVLVFTAVMQIKYVNRALQRFNATMVIPTQFVLFTLSVIIGSAVLYRDFEREQTDDGIKFVCGCGLTFFGVWCITSGRGKEDDDNASDRLEEEEDAIDLVDEERMLPDIRSGDSTTRERQSISAESSHQQRRRSKDQASRSMDGVPTLKSVAGTQDDEDTETRFLHELAHVPPGTASAVHIDPTQVSSAAQKPPIHATTSAPIIPTTPIRPTDPVGPKTPLIRTPSGPATQTPGDVSPHVPTPTPGSAQHFDPNSSHHRLLSRNSVAGLLPGPFTSPLSGSLSAVVADELRRGSDGPGSVRRKSMRPTHALNGGSLSPPKAGFPTHLKRHSIDSGHLDLNAPEEQTDARATGTGSSSKVRGRLRSLSATLGDLFRPSSTKKKRGDEQNLLPDGEPEPGGDGA